MANETAEREWVAAMVQLARDDRESYRKLRAKAWEMVAAVHAGKTPEKLRDWKKNAS